jgi:DNA helicase-2/ATP-dependent DNA helicase PcrA
MEYYFDADVQIIDEFLRKLLSQNTSRRMKAIVETIQKEQDIIIRDIENDLMMVQGVAGSGKTSIALHRAAYLMYQGLANHVLAHNILIISPNSLFEQYISRVLPDLGEENVASAILEEIAVKVLGHKKIQTRDQYLEGMLNRDDEYALMKNRIEFKTSTYFTDIIDRFVADIPDRVLKITNIDYCGQRIMSVKQIRHKITASGHGIPLGFKLKQIEEFVMETVQSFHRIYGNQEEYRRIKKKIQGCTNLDAKALYRRLFTDEHYLPDLLAKSSPEMISITERNLYGKMIHYDDVAALLYLHLRLHGADTYKSIRQVVIDEAQDYYPLHYKVFKLLFGNAKYTVLGDINQTLEKEEDASLYGQIKEILDKPKSILVTMDKSFRCTNEILNFSARFLTQNPEIKSFNRTGNEPQIHNASSNKDLGKMLVAEAQNLLNSGYQSVGLICKTALNAKTLHHDLHGLMEINLIQAGTDTGLEGIFIIPVYLAKGLEFDAVLICDADSVNYHSNEDKKLLYIASTRALHHLAIYGVGELSVLLIPS